MAPLRRKKRTASEILKSGLSGSGGDDDTDDATKTVIPPTTSPMLSKNMLNVSAGGEFYERCKSRRIRTKAALAQSGNAEEAVPLSRRGSGARNNNNQGRCSTATTSTGPNHTSSFGFARHRHPDDEGEFRLDNEMEKKGMMRTMTVRHQYKMKYQQRPQRQRQQNFLQQRSNLQRSGCVTNIQTHSSAPVSGHRTVFKGKATVAKHSRRKAIPPPSLRK